MNPNSGHPLSPVAMFRSLSENWRLIVTLVKREVSGRYRGSAMGLGWSFASPLLMLAVYTFVFSIVFSARWGNDGMSEGKGAFAVILFAGVMIHGLLAECLNRAPVLVTSSVNYVKRVVFPLEILGWVTLGSALFHTLMTAMVLLAAQLLIFKHVPVTALYVPILILPLIFTTLGLTWLFSALGVYLRDVGQFTGILSMTLLFMAPVFYPISALPENIRPWLYLNPLTFIIEQVRAALIWGVSPDWLGFCKHLLIGLIICWLGFMAFQKMRRGFADVI